MQKKDGSRTHTMTLKNLKPVMYSGFPASILCDIAEISSFSVRLEHYILISPKYRSLESENVKISNIYFC